MKAKIPVKLEGQQGPVAGVFVGGWVVGDVVTGASVGKGVTGASVTGTSVGKGVSGAFVTGATEGTLVVLAQFTCAAQLQY